MNRATFFKERFFFRRSALRYAVLGVIILAVPPVSALAQTAQSVVTPWSVEDTQHQSRIRQYQNFRSLQTDEPQALLQDEPVSYEYADSQPKIEPDQSPQTIKKSSSPLPVKSLPSALERMYSKRGGANLEQFGYDLFGVPDENMRATLDALAEKGPSIPSGAVQDNFILGAGDELEIFFTGQRTDRDLYKIDSQGFLVIPDFPPIPAAGRTIGQVRISVEAAAQNLYNTVPYISLSSVKQIGVLVIGHAKRPGRQTLTVFHTVLDAIIGAGGIEKTGSLRQIKLVRNGHSTAIDIYSLLMGNGENSDIQLRDGDRLIIPAIGPTVAIAGEVKRPGIYEIQPRFSGTQDEPENRSEKLTLNEMLNLGGGVLSPGRNRFLMLSVTSAGQENGREIDDASAPAFADGSILIVSKGSEKREGTIELKGHTRRPGLHALEDNKSLKALLSADDISGSDVYPLIGVIERHDQEHLSRNLLDFPPQLVLKGKYDRGLEDGDIVHLFSAEQIRSLFISSEEPSLLHEVSASSREGGEPETIDPSIADFLRERTAFLRGALREPGPYPVAEGISLESALAAAGGLSLEADRSNMEITTTHGKAPAQRTRIDLNKTNPATIKIGAGDAVRVNQKFNKITEKSALVMGEVRNPGRYDLLPGDKVSDLLARAGGLTDQAYPFGAIFSRESERKAEETRFQAQARDVEQSVAAALEADDEKIDAGKIAEARQLASELRNARGVGRLTVEADPAVLAAQPELDMLLEPGDRLFIPKRNLTVRVSGEVLSPASLQFRENKASIDYIHEAGGFTFNADRERTFVIYPDGSAQPLQVSSWNYKPVMIPPGSTIVVPRDPKPFDFIQSAKDVSQILSNLAVTAIFVDDLKDD